MCDELTERDNIKLSTSALDRRMFAKLGTVATFLSLLPGCAASDVPENAIVETEVNVPMAEGVSDSYYVRPSTGTYPAVLIWPDIKGLRPAFKAMGKRLAMAGYAVLVVNPFYRDATHPVVGPDASFSDPETRAFLREMANKLNQDAAMSDARAYIQFLDVQPEVDTSRKMGTAGYCMGGPLIMRTAAAVPERVGAAVSFHGGGLVTDKPDSPHLLIPQTPASVLHAVAENDDARDPEAKIVLAEAYKAAGIPAEIEVYAGANHGWCPPDSDAYNEAQAERAWGRMLALYEAALV